MAFWHDKSLTELSPSEWESLCDGCGKCCLEKLEDQDTGEIHHTNVVCNLMDMGTCQCSKYEERHKYIPDCVPLNPQNVGELKWMPSTCAYRLLAEGKDLPTWHPLVSGDPHSVFDAGMSIRGRAVAEKDVENLEHHLTDWPV